MPIIKYTESVDYVSTGREEWPQNEEYDNYTFLDWMKESSLGSGARSISKKWTVLIATSLAVGYTSIFIDLAAVWLHDLKKGLCVSKLDRWSLLSPYSTCPANDWRNWSELLFRSDATWASVFVNFPIYVVFVCGLVLLAGYVTFTRAPLVKQSGIPEIKLIIAGLNYHMDTYLGASSLLYKVLGLVLVVGSGVWLGKEGPLVHIACCILTVCFERIYGKNRLEGLRRELLSAAVAAGIAVAFNSPIGGVLFVVELLPSYFTPTKLMWNSFVSATIALVALYGFKVFTDGKYFIDEALFHVSFGNFSWLFLETIPFIFLGAVGGVYGHLYTQTYLRFSDKKWKNLLWRKLANVFRVSEAKAPYIELLLVALTTVLFTFPLSMTKLPLSAFLKLLFTDCPVESPTATDVTSTNSSNFMCGSSSVSTMFQLAYIFIQGFVLSSYSYGLALPGGVLMPSFVLGGTLGRLIGIFSQVVQQKIGASAGTTCTAKSCIVSPSSYAVVGAASFVTGITKLTLSVVVIIFELTGAVTYVLPIMVAVMAAKFCNDYLCEENIYDAWLSHEFNIETSMDASQVNSRKGDGLCLFGSISARFRARLPDVPIEKTMVPLSRTRHLVLFPKQPYTLSGLYAYLADDNHEGYPLIASEANPVSLGYLTKKSIYRSVLASIGNVQPTAISLCFQTRVPSFLLPEQQAFEGRISESFSDARFVPIKLDHPTIIVKKSASLKQVIELFERLHLNTLVINDASGRAAGFIDRFKLSRLIHSGFTELQDQLPSESDLDFEIRDSDEDGSDGEASTRRFLQRV